MIGRKKDSVKEDKSYLVAEVNIRKTWNISPTLQVITSGRGDYSIMRNNPVFPSIITLDRGEVIKLAETLMQAV